MPPLKDAQQEAFVQALAGGRLSQTKAYQIAYGVKNANSARAAAARLLAKDNVALRLAELQDRMARKAEVTADSIAAELDELRAIAVNAGHTGAAIQATRTKAQAFGILKTRNEVTGPNGGPLQIDFGALSDDHIRQLLAILALLGIGADSPGLAATRRLAPPER